MMITIWIKKLRNNVSHKNIFINYYYPSFLLLLPFLCPPHLHVVLLLGFTIGLHPSFIGRMEQTFFGRFCLSSRLVQLNSSITQNIEIKFHVSYLNLIQLPFQPNRIVHIEESHETKSFPHLLYLREMNTSFTLTYRSNNLNFIWDHISPFNT